MKEREHLCLQESQQSHQHQEQPDFDKAVLSMEPDNQEWNTNYRRLYVKNVIGANYVKHEMRRQHNQQPRRKQRQDRILYSRNVYPLSADWRISLSSRCDIKVKALLETMERELRLLRVTNDNYPKMIPG
jgi:hypothetical protein